MEIKGTVINVLPLATIQTTKGELKKQSVIIEYTEGKYPRKLEISAMNDNSVPLGTLKVGDCYNFSINLESREFKEKWFTSATVWKWNKIDQNNTTTTKSEDSPY